jgi:hypothetical protein
MGSASVTKRSLPEMEPWTLHNGYDRPIPHRLVEEAGVPGDAFGVIKRGGAGSSLRFGNRSYLARTTPPASFERFSEYLDTVKGKRRKNPGWMLRSVVYLVYVLATYLSLHGRPELQKLLRSDRWATRFTCSPFAPSFLFPWAIEELRSTAYSGFGDSQPAVGANRQSGGRR